MCQELQIFAFVYIYSGASLLVTVLARLCVFGTAMSIKKAFFVFVFIKVMSGRLQGIVLSASMLRFQYSLKFSFSSTLADVYL